MSLTWNLKLGTWNFLEEEQTLSQAAQRDVVGQQFYVTHCTIADSVLNNPGYTVRAASPGDSSLLETAFHYPPYELPIEMWRELPPVELTPRRLARTEHDSQGVWVVHSTYLAKDTTGRDRSYFSHLLLLPSADPAAVLRSWDSSGWAKSYPPGAPKELNREDAKLPIGTLVNDENLTKFLNDTPPWRAELGSTVCPRRLLTSARDRRDLFARVLHALLLLDAEEDEDRKRLYIHAEPGLIALLLYGAVRLLPQQVVGDLTFSTFEPYHRNIREYKLASVVGTFTGNPEKGLESDLGTGRGIALDTIKPSCSSPELRNLKSLPSGVLALVELAQRGEWHLLSSVKHSIGSQASGISKAADALVRARGLANLDAGKVTVDELLVLQADRLAAEELKQRADRVWPVVYAAAVNPQRDDVRKAFAELISQPEHIEELWQEGFESLRNEAFHVWDSRWLVIRSAASAEARKLLQKSVGSKKNEEKLSRLASGIRERLRAACVDVGMMPPRALLVPIDARELDSLLNGSPACAGITAFVLLAKDSLGYLKHIPSSEHPAMRQRAKEFLFRAPSPAIAAYVQEARSQPEPDSHFLDVLFTPYSDDGAKLMDKLLVGGSTLEPSDWRTLCDTVRLTQNEWGNYLLENGRLANLLVGLGGEGSGQDVWAVYLHSLTAALISPEVAEGDDLHEVHAWERKVHANLRSAAERLTKSGTKLASALPQSGVVRLFAANNLLRWIEDPASVERDGCDEVQRACEIFELEPLQLLRVAYKKGGFQKRHPDMESQTLAPIVALFRACFPVDSSFHTAARATREAIRLSRDCPEQTRAALQVFLIQASVPDIHFRALLGEAWHEPLHSDAVRKLGEALKKGAKKTGPKYVPPSAAAEHEAVPVTDEESEPAPIIEKKRCAPNSNSKLWVWVLIAALSAVVVIGLVVAVFVLGR